MTYDPACMTVLAARGTAPFATTSATVDATAGTVALVVDVPAGTGAVQSPAEFGRLLVRLTGPHTSPCALTLAGSTVYRSGDGATIWEASGAIAGQYRRGDARGTGTVESVTQASAILRFLINPDSDAALASFNALNAASIKPDVPSAGQADAGDQVSLADAVPSSQTG